MPEPGKIEQQLQEALAPALREYAVALAAGGHDLVAVGGAEAVAAVVRAALPRPNRFAARLGPVYSTGQLQRLLPGPGAPPVTDQAVRARRQEGRLIGVKTADGRWAWPAFQFRAAPGRLVPRDDVLALWRLLPTDTDTHDPITLAAWLTGARRDLEGMTPLAWLNAHGLDERLRTAAGAVRRRAAA